MNHPAGNEILRPDLCVIGAGTAGYQAASAAGAMGAATVVIEKANFSESLPRGGDLAWQLAVSAIRTGGTRPTWPELRAHALAAARRTAPAFSAERLGALGVRVIRATGRFRDERTLEAGPHLVAARRFLIATGAAPRVPALPGLDLVPALTADTIFDLRVLPRRLAILGADAFGIEAAQLFRRLGSEVAVLEAGAPLAAFDAELTQSLLARLAAEGVELHGRVRVLRVDPADGGFRFAIVAAGDVDAGPELFVEVSHVLVAGDRAPNVAEWRPDKAKVACTTRGVAVRPNGRTGNPRIYAAGDVTGLAASAGGAQAQAAVALRSALFRQPVGFDPGTVPKIVGTSPEIASVGLTETQARARAGKIRVLRWPYSENGRARAEGRTGGHIKVLAAANGRILGAGIVGAEAGEVIGLWSLAVARGLKMGDIAALPLPVSRFSDLSRRVALSGLAVDLRSPWVRRALALMRRLG